ncbi:MAG: Hsp70 family protein [Candidatus Methanomethylicaceae archaeon]
MPIYGIDLGTTFSAIAYVNPNREPVCIPIGGERGRTIPSAVLFVNENEAHVGWEALEREGALLIQFAKRDIGLERGRRWEFRGWTYTPEEISALILRKIVQVVGAHSWRLPPVRDVVITHPQYFYMSQKEATSEAGRLAGLNVRATIPEPTAAAIAYGVCERAEEESRTILVFDLGGGTFDVTLMKVTQRKFEVLGSAGDAQLGGIDWDAELIRYLKEEFRRRAGVDFDDVASHGQRVALEQTAQRMKEQLSDQDEVREVIYAGTMHMLVTVTREAFEQMCAPLVDRCVQKCGELLQLTGYKWSELDEVILVGGSTKMPMIQRAVRAAFGREPRIDQDPKLAVAHGAAIWGYWVEQGWVDARWGREGSSSLMVEPVEVSGRTAHGLGVLARRGEHEIIDIIIPRNTQTPHHVAKEYYTAWDNMTELIVPLYESDSEDPDSPACVRLGQVIIEGLPPGPRGQPVRVNFEIDLAGRLRVKVTHIPTGAERVVEVRREGLVGRNEPDFNDRFRRLNSICVR